MTTMALTAPPLKSSFRALGFADADPKGFEVVMEQWKSAGRGVVAPSRSAVTFPEASEAAKRIFVYRVAEGERDYILVEGAKASACFLGLARRGSFARGQKQASSRSSATPVR